MESVDDIIKTIAGQLALPESTIRSATGVLLDLLREKTTGLEFGKFADLVPGTAELVSRVPRTPAGATGGLLGVLGGQASDLARVSTALRQAGVPADKIMPLAKAFFEKAREAADPEMMSELFRNFPVLRTLMTP